MVAHTILLEISCTGSFKVILVLALASIFSMEQILLSNLVESIMGKIHVESF